MARDLLAELERLRGKEPRRVVGLMSGTSVDGVSLALADIWGSYKGLRWRLLAYKTYPYPRELREEIFRLFSPQGSSSEAVCLMNFVLGEFYGAAVNRFLEETGYRGTVDLVASHGQTIWHIPAPRRVAGIETRATLQIGEPAVIAERTGLPVVADFRVRDVAAGGQGAPIIAYVDFVMFRSEERNVAVQNIGGIANVTYLPAGCEIDDVVAFDTGPGNMVIDGVVRRLTGGRLDYDVDGEMARRGRVHRGLLEWLLSHPYLDRRPPKTTGREEFGDHFVEEVLARARSLGLRPEDVVATVTEFTVESIARSYERFLGPVDLVVLGGGGAKNRYLVERLRERLGVEVRTHGDYGIPEQAKEPLGMAILGSESVMGVPNNVPGATGAVKRVVMGKFVP